jgi:hypothetical protein
MWTKDDAVWHVATDNVQQGPMKRSEILAKLRDGTIDGATLVWRPGFEGWLPLREVSEFSTPPPEGKRSPTPIMRRLNNPRLLFAVGLGIGLLGFVLAGCASPDGFAYGRVEMLCAYGIHDLSLFGVRYVWILAGATCLVLYAIYRMMEERHRH